MTDGTASAVGMRATPCRRVSSIAVNHVDIGIRIVPRPSPRVADKINGRRGARPMEIFQHERAGLDPPIKARDI